MTIDDTLLKRVAEGDEGAFNVLYDAYYTPLCAYAASFVADWDISTQMVSNVFVAIWDRRPQLISPVANYLFRSVRNQCINHLRNNRLQNRVFRDLTAEQVEVHIETFGTDDFDRFEFAQITHTSLLVQRFVADLPARCREVMEQYLYHGLTANEISELKGISPATVRVHLKNGIDHIRSRFSDISNKK